MTEDLVVLVNSDNEPVGTLDKFQAHRHPAKLHRAVSVWLYNDEGEVLLQRRSDQKIVGAGWWANTICGNVRPGETDAECALRRLKEELGIEGAEIAPLYAFNYAAHCNDEYGEHEHDQVFIGSYRGPVSPKPNEASDAQWLNMNYLIQWAGELNFPSPQETLNMSPQELAEKTKPEQFPLNSQAVLLSPWTILMLRDSRLKKQFA